MRPTVSGSGHEARAEIRCGIARRVPEFQERGGLRVNPIFDGNLSMRESFVLVMKSLSASP